MRTLANILWHFPFFGFITAFFTFLLGSLLVITVVAAPIGLGVIQLSKFLMAPFSREMIDKSKIQPNQNVLWKTYGWLVRIIYFPFGLFLAIVTLFQIIGLVISIEGIPMAIILVKSLGTYFNPVNKVCVHLMVSQEIAKQKAQNYNRQ